MTRRRNEVLIQWTENSCKGEINRVNVKHILLDVKNITAEAFVMACLKSRKYRGEVKDFLKWSAQKRFQEDVRGKHWELRNEDEGGRDKRREG